jgi:hypothetical protein
MGLEVGGTKISASAITAAYYQPRGDLPATVRAVGDRGQLLFEAEVTSRDQADALLRALGHDVAQRRFRVGEVPTVSGAIATAFVALLAIAAGLASKGRVDMDVIAGGMAFMALASLGLLFRGRRAEVGADGLVVTARRRRFVPYSAVREVRLRSRRARSNGEVALTSGERIRVGSLGTGGRHVLEQLALPARIEGALAAYRRTTAPPDLAGDVARGGRSVTAWRADLSRLNADREGYREPAMRAAQEDRLWDILEDPGTPEDARAAAAVALRGATGGDVLQRLRVAGDAIASPRLRVAVETAADPEAPEHALDAALEPFVDDEEPEAVGKTKEV